MYKRNALNKTKRFCCNFSNQNAEKQYRFIKHENVLWRYIQ